MNGDLAEGVQFPFAGGEGDVACGDDGFAVNSVFEPRVFEPIDLRGRQ